MLPHIGAAAPWADPEVVSLHRLPMHVPMPTDGDARARRDLGAVRARLACNAALPAAAPTPQAQFLAWAERTSALTRLVNPVAVIAWNSHKGYLRELAAGGVANTAVTTGTPPAAYELPKVTDVSDTGTAPGGPGEYGEVTDPDSTETGIPAGVTTSVTNNGADPTDDPTVLTLKERTPMPNTGSDSVPLVLGGLGLMLAGLVLVLLARRRRKTA